MGTHPTLPSKLLQDGGETLGERLRKNPELLGNRGLDDLPFLFKVLAIRKALSIQSHPDKKFAEQLHAVAPNLYKGALPQNYNIFFSPIVLTDNEQTRITNPKWPSR